MALSQAASTIRGLVLKHMRIPIQTTNVGAASSLAIFRSFAGGAYLDKDDVTQRVLHVAKHFQRVDPGKVTPTAHFEKDLGLDSLDVVELVMAVEEEFAVEIPDADADKILTMEDAINYIASHPQAK